MTGSPIPFLTKKSHFHWQIVCSYIHLHDLCSFLCSYFRKLSKRCLKITVKVTCVQRELYRNAGLFMPLPRFYSGNLPSMLLS